jgi:polysaccharide export outer membrane protein
MKLVPARTRIIWAFGLICLWYLAGCASNNARADRMPVSPSDAQLVNSGLTSANFNPSLEALWTSRRKDLSDFAVGPGDVLEIQVTGVKELDDRTVRVDGKGDIDLPLLGSMHVAGLSESQLDTLLISRLSDYLYHPQAQIFVKSYNNRQVSVTGEVRNPANYTLNGPDDTIRELIQRAGGVTQQASPEIAFTPGSASIGGAKPPFVEAEGSYSAASYNATSQATDSNPSEMSAAGSDTGHSLIIDLTATPQHERYLDLPVRPGDSIFIPSAGAISTVGWLYHPQTMPITHNLSVIGAVAASGGMLFAANEHDVRIVRRQSDGQIAVITADVANIQAGKSADVPLRNGDIVDVPYSALKIPGYALYYVAQGLVTYAPSALLVSGF